MKRGWLIVAVALTLFSCMRKNSSSTREHKAFTGKDGEIKLIVLAPGHFHANLLQKSAIAQVNDSVFVYANTEDSGLRQYLSSIESFNQRGESPTRWQIDLYTGNDFLDKMVEERKGNVVVLAGNNKEKTGYIAKAVEAGFNVLSDKPMAINSEDFRLLEQAYSNAEAKNVLIYDMMTERYDMLNIIEKELINDSNLFGELQQGTAEDPAVFMESVHHFYKEVSGTPLMRPAWYYDVKQQGEGIADVTTHLIDLLFWKCFPEQAIDYTQDIKNIASTHWPTSITLPQFTQSTGETAFPDYLEQYINNSTLNVYANGTLNFDVKNNNVGIKVIWNWQAPTGSGDTFMSVVKGTKAILKTVQNKEQGFVKQLYIQKPEEMGDAEFSDNLKKAIGKIQANYPFVSTSPTAKKSEYLINIPTEDREGHESHFRYVAEKYFKFLVNRNMPEWERANTLAKYYITTKGVEVATERN